MNTSAIIETIAHAMADGSYDYEKTGEASISPLFSC